MEKYDFQWTLDDLHTIATALGYGIENLRKEEANPGASPSVRRYKEICRGDQEKILDKINENIRFKMP